MNHISNFAIFDNQSSLRSNVFLFISRINSESLATLPSAAVHVVITYVFQG